MPKIKCLCGKYIFVTTEELETMLKSEAVKPYCQCLKDVQYLIAVIKKAKTYFDRYWQAQ